MTHAYSDTNPHHALYNAARDYPEGIEGLAEDLGMNAQVLRAKLAPHTKTHHTNFEEVSRITDAMVAKGMPDARRALQAMCWRHGLVSYPLPTVVLCSTDDLVQTVCSVMKEVGDVASAVADAIEDHVITEQEMDLIDREFHDAQVALCTWHARVKQRHEETNPARVK